MNTKKDLNYLASVEKAIAEKYGKDTVQDFRNEWESEKEKKYLNQLKELKTKLDKLSATKQELVIGEVKINKGHSQRKDDRTCPVCKTYSFSRKDDLYMNRFKCCYDCYVDFVIGREEAWKNGERPTVEHIEYALRRRK
jgi:DNA repair exonuclease SbcCD ATPase subunit